MERTIKEWFELVEDDKLREKLFYNSEKFPAWEINREAVSLVEAISLAFVWGKTDEGGNYWNDICENPPKLIDTNNIEVIYDIVSSLKDHKEPTKGLRFNEGKLRYDLLHPIAQEGIVKVLTKGAEKYEPHNWEKGMEWSKVIASMKRHLAAFEKGEDFDPETGELHIDHLQCNAHFLSAYYKIAPHYDDRQHGYTKNIKIGLDIDEVLADWVGHWTTHHGQEVPETWNFDRNIKDKFDKLSNDKEFWLSIPIKTNPNEIHFEPHCYITSRSIPKDWTEEWLDKNGFPTMPVYSIGHNESKVDCVKKSGIDIYVDDRFENFVEINNAGICCYLFDAPHNRRYDVGYKRIKSLSELKFY